MNTILLIASIGSLVLHFVPSILKIVGVGGSPAVPAPSPANPVPGPISPTGRPVLDLIHLILQPLSGSSPTANILDKDLQILRQVLDSLGVKPLVPPSAN